MGVKNKEEKISEDKEETEINRFIGLVQAAMEKALNLGMDPKDMNALFANCIKFIAVKNKLTGEGKSFFDDD
jgi:hypothetical protein